MDSNSRCDVEVGDRINLAYKTNVAHKALVDGYQKVLEAMQQSKVEYLKKRTEISVGGLNAMVEVEWSHLDQIVSQAEVAVDVESIVAKFEAQRVEMNQKIDEAEATAKARLEELKNARKAA